MEIVDAGDQKKKLHLELNITPDITSDNVKVWTEANKIFVSGMQEQITETTDEHGEVCKSREHHHFQKAYVLPGVVDASSMMAEMHEGHLVVEAPLTQL